MIWGDVHPVHAVGFPFHYFPSHLHSLHLHEAVHIAKLAYINFPAHYICSRLMLWAVFVTEARQMVLLNDFV